MAQPVLSMAAVPKIEYPVGASEHGVQYRLIVSENDLWLTVEVGGKRILAHLWPRPEPHSDAYNEVLGAAHERLNKVGSIHVG
jgi:hypothetical protein